MKIINDSGNQVLADNAGTADTFFRRVKGLLGRKDLLSGEALIIKPCNSIHTFFMRFPIDILFMDKNNRVVKAISCLKPFQLTPIYFTAHYVIELPAGVIEATNTRLGDSIKII